MCFTDLLTTRQVEIYKMTKKDVLVRAILVLPFLLYFFTSVSFAGEKEIVRKVDDFSNFELVTFKDPLKFERTKGISIGTAWLTPEAAIDKDKAIKWLRFNFTVQGFSSGWITREPVRASQATNGTLKIKVDDRDIIELKAINPMTDVSFEHSTVGDEYTEEAIFSVSIDQLKVLAGATTIKARLTGFNDRYIDIPNKNYEINKEWAPNIDRFCSEITK